MNCICRTANTSKAGLIVGALRITCNGLCTAARFHSADENPGCFLGCGEGQDCLRHNNQCPTLLRSLFAIWLGTGDCIFPTAIFNDMLFNIAVRNDRLCTLVSGLFDAFVTVFNLWRTHQDHGLNFRALMYGRIKMMTALFPAWAHTYQTMCLEFSPGQLRQEAFQVTQTQEKVSYVAQLPNSYQMTGIASPGWKVFTDGGCKRQMDGTVLAGWGIAAVSPDDFVRILCGPVVCDASPSGILRGHPRNATTRRNSLVWPKLSDGLFFSFVAVKGCGLFL